ncbi:hypothetical protein [Eleftheria terrae]|uniref:hypothetical protein n=1 Tax=Eleftheria terrae TaxID=1597781 RepID=UPI00263AB227|nr:hypothetical protein [Eleftheria terrae]WKB54572.1 hypothetical protein N7L95_09415 [Eleftheria terrae]
MNAMPTYAWSCHACGKSHGSLSEACSTCGCPAAATSRQIDTARARHIERGGQLQGQAGLDAARDLSAVEVLLRPLAFLILGGWWPARRSPPPAERS